MNLAGFICVAALPAASNLLLTPILVRLLGIPGFAVWSIIEPSILIFATFAGLGMQYGLLFTTASGGTEPRLALSVAATCTLPVALVASIVVWMFMRAQMPGLGWYAVTTPFTAEALSVLAISSMRGQRKLGLWVMFELVRSTGLLVVVTGAMLIAPALVSSVETFLMIRGICTVLGVMVVFATMRVRPVVDRALAIRMAMYGLPIAGAAMIQLLSNSTDRYLMALLERPAREIAIYAAHQRLAGILSVLTVTPINLWFAVEAMRRDTRTDAGFFQGVLLAVTALLAFLMLSAFVVAPLLWPFLFPQLPFSAPIYALLAGGIAPQALGIITNIGGLREKKTHVNAIIVACAIVTAGSLGLLLIPEGGGLGAAFARFASLAVTAAAGWILSHKIAPVRHRLVELLPFLAAIGCSLVVLFSAPFGLAFITGTAAALTFLASGLWLHRRRFAMLANRPPSVRI